MQLTNTHKHSWRLTVIFCFAIHRVSTRDFERRCVAVYRSLMVSMKWYTTAHSSLRRMEIQCRCSGPAETLKCRWAHVFIFHTPSFDELCVSRHVGHGRHPIGLSIGEIVERVSSFVFFSVGCTRVKCQSAINC